MSNYVRIFKNLPSRDGSSLAGELHLPAIGRQFPALLHRTERPMGELMEFYREAVRLGFAVFVQNVRGCGDSGGEFRPYENEAEDGEDAIRWLMGQPWCNGVICGFGIDYSAQAVLAAAQKCFGGISGIILIHPSNDLPNAGFHSNGVFRLKWCRQALEWAKCCSTPSPETTSALEHETAYATTTPNIESIADALPHLRKFPGIFRWLKTASIYNPNRIYETDASSRQYALSVADNYERMPDIPTLLLTDWRNDNCAGTIKIFQENICRHMAPTRLEIGSNKSDAVLRKKAIDWLDKWLHPGNDWDAYAKGIHFAMINADDRSEAMWPLLDAKNYYFFLCSGGFLSLNKSTAEDSRSMFPFFPLDPTPSENSGPGTLISRKDMISFSSSLLKRPMAICGSIKASVWAMASQTTSLAVSVVDLWIPNDDIPVCREICHGIVRMTIDGGSARAQHLEFSLPPIAYSIPAGHRLQVRFSPCLFPEFQVIGDLPDAIAILHEVNHQSLLSIPILPVKQ